jgi:hypothetical protein
MEPNSVEEDLSDLWGKFSLLEDETSGVSLEDSEIEPMVSRGKYCLIGKLLSDRVVTKDFLKASMKCAWRPAGETVFQAIEDNMFVVEFDNEWDKIRIMEGRPWLFDGYLISLAEFDGLTFPANINFDSAAFWVRMYKLPLSCMGRDVGFKMGASMGTVGDVDVMEGEAGWGSILG